MNSTPRPQPGPENSGPLGRSSAIGSCLELSNSASRQFQRDPIRTGRREGGDRGDEFDEFLGQLKPAQCAVIVAMTRGVCRTFTLGLLSTVGSGSSRSQAPLATEHEHVRPRGDAIRTPCGR